MSVHIPSTLKVTQLNVASTAAVGNLKLQDGEGGSWLLYADTGSTKLIYATDGTSACFVLDASHQYALSLRVPGVVYGAGVQAELITADRLVLNGSATVAGTLAADTLKATTLDISNLDFSDATLNVSSISVAGTAEINTLSAVQVLAEQGAIKQLTVDDTLAAHSAVLAELTVLQTLTVHTVEARDKVNAPLIVADRAEFDTLYVNGKAITGSSSGGSSGGGGDVTVPLHLTVHTLTANETISIPGSGIANGDIELTTNKGIRVGTAGTIEIADEGSNAVVRIDRTGIKALKVSASTASVGALTSSSTVTTQNLTVGSSGVIDGSLQVKELNVSSSVIADGAEITTATITALTSNTAKVETLSAVDTLTESISAGSIDVDSIQIAEDAIISGTVQGTDIVASSSVTAPLIDANEIQAGNITVTNNITAASIAATAITTSTLQANGDAQVDGDMSVGGRLDVDTLFVNGVEITDNGGISEIPPTIQVSEVQALSTGQAVSIPQMQGRHLTLSDSMSTLLPSEYPPLALHVSLNQYAYIDTDPAHSAVTSLRAESGFRAPVTFVSPAGETQVLPLGGARFTQRTIATACQQPLYSTIDMGDVAVSVPYVYCDRAWLEVCPAGVNSINNEQSTVTLRADRAITDDDNNNAFDIANGEITSSGICRLNSASFTLAPEALTARIARQLPRSKINVLIYDKATAEHPEELTPLLYATDIKTEITPSCFKAEATATLLTYGALTGSGSGVDILDYSDNLKSSIQLDVSPDAYTSDLNYIVGDVNKPNPNSGIYVRPNNVIIQAPIDLPSSDVVPIPANPSRMGIGLFGRNIVLQAEDVIKLDASTSVIGALHVSGLTKASAASVVGSLSAQSLYVNGVQITGNGGASGSGFSGQYTEGNVVLGYANSAHFAGLVQKDTVTALGYDVYKPSTDMIASFDTDRVVGILTDDVDVNIKAASQVNITALSTTILGAFNSKMFGLESDSYGASISLDAGRDTWMTLRSGSILCANANHFDLTVRGSQLVYSDDDGTGVWQFGNKVTRTNFYTDYSAVTDNRDPQAVLNEFSVIGALHACMPLSIILELFQLKSGLSFPPQS